MFFGSSRTGVNGWQVVAGWLLLVSTAHAESGALTRQRVAELVRAAPAAQLARAELDVSRAAVMAADVASLENPVVSGLGGVRFDPDGSRGFNGVATLAWPVDLGGKRGARIDAAKAESRAAVGQVEMAEAELLLAALLQHATVLRDQQQLAIARERHALAERLYAAAQRRRAAGTVPELDVALAAMQERRDASALEQAAGDRDGDRLALFTLLGVSDAPTVEGSLVPEGEPRALAALVKENEQRVEVRSAASMEAARAKASRERAARWPTINLLMQYERDDGANIGLIGLAVPLPVLNANRAEVLTSSAALTSEKARAARNRVQLDGRVRQLYARFIATRAAMDTLAPTAALATRAVNLATRGYELGENDLASVLLVRREAVEAEEALLETQHAHAVVKIELLTLAGKLPR
jgi:cobalt-zinc-cadmium efflux system outer membrane protein